MVTTTVHTTILTITAAMVGGATGMFIVLLELEICVSTCRIMIRLPLFSTVIRRAWRYVSIAPTTPPKSPACNVTSLSIQHFACTGPTTKLSFTENQRKHQHVTILLVSLYYPVPSSVYFDDSTSPRRLVELVPLSGPKASRLIALISVQTFHSLCQKNCVKMPV